MLRETPLWSALRGGLSGGFIVGFVAARDALILSSPARLALYQQIVKRPGISLHELARRAGVTWANARYHTLRLEAAGLIRTRVVGRRRLCFLQEEGQEDLVEARALLDEPTARLLAVYFVDHPGASIVRAIRETGMSQRAVYHHVKRFVEAGLLAKADDRSYRGLVPTSRLYSAL